MRRLWTRHAPLSGASVGHVHTWGHPSKCSRNLLVSLIALVRGSEGGAWVTLDQISAHSDQISGPKGSGSRRRDPDPIQISGCRSGRYLVTAVTDILQAGPDYLVCAGYLVALTRYLVAPTRYLVPWGQDPAGGILTPSRYLVTPTRYLVPCGPAGSQTPPDIWSNVSQIFLENPASPTDATVACQLLVSWFPSPKTAGAPDPDAEGSIRSM